MKIVMLEPLSVNQSIIDTLSKNLQKHHEFIPCFNTLTIEEKKERLIDADIAIITNGYLDEEILNVAPNLKMISVGFTGVNHIPADYCIKNNILISNSQGYATIPTAEIALTLMLMATRYVPQTIENCQNSKTKENFIGYELTNKKVGIVGTGAIGLHLAKLLKGFDVTILGYDSKENDEAINLGITYTSLKELFQSCDIISIHLPLLDNTKGLIDAQFINLMKKNALLINCARGPIVDANALKNAIDNKSIRGAGVDVYDIEPPLPNDHVLLNNSSIITTPHIAFASKESFERRAKIVFDNVYSYLEGNPINVIKKLK